MKLSSYIYPDNERKKIIHYVCIQRLNEEDVSVLHEKVPADMTYYFEPLDLTGQRTSISKIICCLVY